ncbi:MAG TPA: hypothetical protein VJ456_17140 [Acidimicrobiia bacterium]|nr:hypothetical protein [Acidimicrobiia bacterium]
MSGRSEPMYLARAKSLMAGGFALLAFVAALAAGTAGAPAFGGFSWVMVTAGAAGVVYVAGAVLVAALVDLRAHSGRGLSPATITTHRGDRPRSSGR